MTRRLIATLISSLALPVSGQTIYKCVDHAGGTLIVNSPLGDSCKAIVTGLHAVRPSDSAAKQSPVRGESSSGMRERPRDASGSGVLVSPGVVLTSNHVVQSCKEITVGDQGVLASVKARDTQSDLALLSVTKPLLNVNVAKLRSDEPRLGESVAAVGYPLHGLLSSDMGITFGSISAIKGPGEVKNLFQFSAPVQPGNSGGPILDKRGQLLGVVKGGLNVGKMQNSVGITPQNVNFGVPVTVVREFMARSGVDVTLGNHLEAVSGEELAALARQFTYPIICRA